MRIPPEAGVGVTKYLTPKQIETRLRKLNYRSMKEQTIRYHLLVLKHKPKLLVIIRKDCMDFGIKSNFTNAKCYYQAPQKELNDKQREEYFTLLLQH